MFFDPELGESMEKGSLARSVIDRYCVVVMGGIAAEAERDAAFVVACARGHGGVAALPGFAGCAARAWARAWEWGAANDVAP